MQLCKLHVMAMAALAAVNEAGRGGCQCCWQLTFVFTWSHFLKQQII